MRRNLSKLPSKITERIWWLATNAMILLPPIVAPTFLPILGLNGKTLLAPTLRCSREFSPFHLSHLVFPIFPHVTIIVLAEPGVRYLEIGRASSRERVFLTV